MDLEQSAFEALRFASAQSLKLYKQPLVITYSGGKDSDVLLRLAENSGIPFEVLHSLTTADAPKTVYHVRDTFRRMEEKDAADQIEHDQKEIAELKAKVEQYRALIPSGQGGHRWND